MNWLDKWYILLCCVLMVFEIFVYIKMKKRVKIELISKDVEIQQLKKMTVLDKNCHEIIHNTSFYLKLIHQLAIENKNEEIIDTVERLTGKLEYGKLCQYSNYTILNAILCDYSQKAKEHHVIFDIYVEPGCVLWHIRDMDLAAMLGNLLENAVEATSMVENGSIIVRIFMHQNGKMCMIKVVNDYCEELRMKKGNILSSKDEGIHGIGLKSIARTAEHYKGIFNYFVENKKFYAVLILPVENGKSI